MSNMKGVAFVIEVASKCFLKLRICVDGVHDLTDDEDSGP